MYKRTDVFNKRIESYTANQFEGDAKTTKRNRRNA